MKVLLVIPRYVSHQGEYYNLPLGLGYIGAIAVRDGHHVESINLNEVPGDHNDALRRKLMAFRPDVCCTGGLSPFLPVIQEIFGICREIDPSILTVCGGGTLSGDPEPVMRMSGIDVGVIGEGEETFSELLHAHQHGGDFSKVNGLVFRQSDGSLKRNAPRASISDLDALPWPDYDLLDFRTVVERQRPFDNYFFQTQPDSRPRSIEMITSRSCPFSCTFCFHPAGKVYRERSLDAFFTELEHYVETYGINMVMITDELFSLRKARLHEFCERIEPMGLQWMVQLHVSSVDRETIRKMEWSGSPYISYGIESMDQSILVSMKKKSKVEKIQEALETTYEMKSGIQGNILFGDRAETVETANNSLKWWADNRKYQVYLSALQVFPGSPDYIEAVRDGLIPDRDFYVNELPLEVNISSMNDANMMFIRYLTRAYNDALLIPAKLRRFEISERQCEGRSLAYDIEFDCPRCGETNLFEGSVIDHKEVGSLRVSCRSCRSRSDIPNITKEQSAYRIRHLQDQLLGEAQGHLAKGENALARPLLERAAGLKGYTRSRAVAGMLLAKLMFDEGKVLDGFQLASFAIRMEPFDPSQHVMFAEMLARMGVIGGAIMHLEQAIVLDAANQEAHKLLRFLKANCSDVEKSTYVRSISDAPPPQRKSRDAKPKQRIRHKDKLQLADGRFDVEPEFAHLEPTG